MLQDISFSYVFYLENICEVDMLWFPLLISLSGPTFLPWDSSAIKSFLIVFDKTQEALLFSSRPKFKGILGLDYTIGKFNVSLNNTLFGPTRFHQNGLGDGTDTEFTPAIVTDLGISYQVTKKATLSVNVNNLLNVKPKWQFVDIATGAKTTFDRSKINDATAKYFTEYNLITFDGRYDTTTYDGSQFSQLGLMLNASLNVRF